MSKGQRMMLPKNSYCYDTARVDIQRMPIDTSVHELGHGTKNLLDCETLQRTQIKEEHVSNCCYQVPSSYGGPELGPEHFFPPEYVDEIPIYHNSLEPCVVFNDHILALNSEATEPSPHDSSGLMHNFTSGSFEEEVSPYPESMSQNLYTIQDTDDLVMESGPDHNDSVPRYFCVDQELTDKPYAKLIFEALMNAPDHKMMLREIYDWFLRNTNKPRSSGSYGWQNSIRHNLSMNRAFENDKTERKGRGQSRKANSVWILTEDAIKHGVQSTTRYRKNISGRKIGPIRARGSQRQKLGLKGGGSGRCSTVLRSNDENPHVMDIKIRKTREQCSDQRVYRSESPDDLLSALSAELGSPSHGDLGNSSYALHPFNDLSEHGVFFKQEDAPLEEEPLDKSAVYGYFGEVPLDDLPQMVCEPSALDLAA